MNSGDLQEMLVSFSSVAQFCQFELKRPDANTLRTLKIEHLHCDHCAAQWENDGSLPWDTRLMLLADTAEGMLYCESPLQ